MFFSSSYFWTTIIKKASLVFPPGLGFPRKNLVYCVALLSMWWWWYDNNVDGHTMIMWQCKILNKLLIIKVGKSNKDFTLIHPPSQCLQLGSESVLHRKPYRLEGDIWHTMGFSINGVPLLCGRNDFYWKRRMQFILRKKELVCDNRFVLDILFQRNWKQHLRRKQRRIIQWLLKPSLKD